MELGTTPTMDCLLTYYTENFTKLDGNIFEVFTKFYDLDLSPVHSWLETQFKNKVKKDDKLSTCYRQEGNKYYARKNLTKSLELYTKSLCCAIPNSREYGLALANRSAVSFEMKEYQHCIKDIELCFKTDYPKDLKPKIYLRKIECYFERGHRNNLLKSINEAMNFFSNENLPDKDKYIAKLEQIRKAKIPVRYEDFYNVNPDDIPKFDDSDENKFFAYASSKIKMSYDKVRGRHVMAVKSIKKGDILFIEKAFVFAPVFKENKEFGSFKCYHCLKDVISSIPYVLDLSSWPTCILLQIDFSCRSCTLCVYCNEKCRESSWNECHKWECKGMRANIWYYLGIGFPAFKALLKGVKSGCKNTKGNYEEDLKQFGSKEDNYPYFNRLVSNIYKSKNAAPYIVMAAIIVTYLKKYTDFFTWFLKQKNCPKDNFNNLIRYVGGMITKHIAQISSNSCIIEHWTYSATEILFPDILITVACGMFPSVSIMNHSCRPNVTNFFICDTIIVKALEDIQENEEIFNCYGIDYRGMHREQRQIACRSLYHFECKCVICSDQNKEIEMLDSYLCPKCKGQVPEIPNMCYMFCLNCEEEYALGPFRLINEEAQKCLENYDGNQLESLYRCLKIRESILYTHHKDFEEVYYRLYNYYVDNCDAENMFKFFHLWLDNERARRGENSRGIGTKLYEAALAILHCLQTTGQPKNCTNLKDFLQNVEHMIREAKFVLNLYYPTYITNRLSKKIHFISNK